MAILNGLYIHVIDEQLVSDIVTTSHPVEQGIPITDTVQAKPVIISLSGKIVDYGDTTATEVIAKLDELKNAGSLIEYRGRNVASNMQIQSFDRTHPNTNNGGADFTMELKQIRIAKSSYVPKKESTTKKQEEAKKSEVIAKTIEVGASVIFKGGSVYASSDATKAASTRDRSTCKVTNFSNASYSKHPYHLVSSDGKGVYGWVDVSSIEGVAPPSTSGKTNAGTQQVTSNTNTSPSTTASPTPVYHKVKSGDTVWALVNKQYKSYNKTCQWVIDNSPDAFSRKGDASTLKVGAQLLMGYK